MKFASDTPQFGAFADPRLLAQLAHEAEDAGWDAFFLWDHIQVGWPDPVADPWIALAAMAMSTSRILLGPMVTPLYRRHPWKVAREAVTLDHLSGGRVVLGVGLGDDFFSELRTFGGPTHPRRERRCSMKASRCCSDSGCAEKFSLRGESTTRSRDAQFLPAPVQKPRIPDLVSGRHVATQAAVPARRTFRGRRTDFRRYRNSAHAFTGSRPCRVCRLLLEIHAPAFADVSATASF